MVVIEDRRSDKSPMGDKSIPALKSCHVSMVLDSSITKYLGARFFPTFVGLDSAETFLF